MVNFQRSILNILFSEMLTKSLHPKPLSIKTRIKTLFNQNISLIIAKTIINWNPLNISEIHDHLSIDKLTKPQILHDNFMEVESQFSFEDLLQIKF